MTDKENKFVKIIAVDFDGTLFENQYPCIGDPILETITALKKEKESGAKIILWTNRTGTYLREALEACEYFGIKLDAINDNIPEMKEFYGDDPRKVSATEYWDDRAWRATNKGINKWHDLRKDPTDLPEDRDVVLAFDGTEYGVAKYYKTGFYHGWATGDQDFEPSSVIAWKLIEPFEVK